MTIKLFSKKINQNDPFFNRQNNKVIINSHMHKWKFWGLNFDHRFSLTILTFYRLNNDLWI